MDISVYYIRTLVDICGVLILTVQHEQLREAALHSELAAMDEVLHRQYEQYKRSKEGIRHQQPLSRAEDSNRGHPRRA